MMVLHLLPLLEQRLQQQHLQQVQQMQPPAQRPQGHRVPAVVLLLVPPLVLAVLLQVLAVLLDLLDHQDPQVEDTMVAVINKILL